MTDEEAFCRELYAETNDLFTQVQSDLGEASGFRILYGPPFVNAPYLFVGYQPGGRKETTEEWCAKGYHNGWPAVSDYVGESWPLARQLRTIFGVEILRRCSGLNAVFFRSPTVREWKKKNPALVARLEKFSIDRAQRIAAILRPKRIVVIGFGTFNLLSDGGEVAVQLDKRVLVRRGELWGVPAFGIIHLSGARISRGHIDAIQKFFADANSN